MEIGNRSSLNHIVLVFSTFIWREIKWNVISYGIFLCNMFITIVDKSSYKNSIFYTGVKAKVVGDNLIRIQKISTIVVTLLLEQFVSIIYCSGQFYFVGLSYSKTIPCTCRFHVYLCKQFTLNNLPSVILNLTYKKLGCFTTDKRRFWCHNDMNGVHINVMVS